MDYAYAVGDKKCNLPGAGAREAAHWELAALFEFDSLDLSSERLSSILDDLWNVSPKIGASGFRLIESLVAEAIRLRDLQALNAVESLPTRGRQRNLVR